MNSLSIKLSLSSLCSHLASIANNKLLRRQCYHIVHFLNVHLSLVVRAKNHYDHFKKEILIPFVSNRNYLLFQQHC